MFKILDCTFRDGGYHNQWHFPHKIVQDQLNVLSKFGVDYVEIGFRFYELNKNLGNNAYSLPNYINSFDIPRNLKISVMSNASELLVAFNKGDLDSLYPGKDIDKNISLVRIACHYNEFGKLKKIINILKKKRYQIGLNLMQISNFSLEEIEQFINFCNNNNIDICYFADSLGSLSINETEEISKFFNIKSRIPFGIHAHDNLGLALSNSLIAHKNGASFIDSSITGMGRGPGNTILEELLIEKEIKLNKHYFNKLNELIDSYYKDLKVKLNWGKSAFFYLAAKKNIHPTFIQEIESIKDINSSKKVDFIYEIAKMKDPHKYSESKLWNSFVPAHKKNNLNNDLKMKNILLLGPSSENYLYLRSELHYFIKINKASTICLNDFNSKFEDIINYRVFSHSLRYDNFKNYKKKIISPFFVKKSKDICFEIKISDRYKLNPKFFEMKKPYTLPYIIAVLKILKVKSITFFGFDGTRENEDFEIFNVTEKLMENFLIGNTLLKTNFTFLKKINFFDKIDHV